MQRDQILRTELNIHNLNVVKLYLCNIMCMRVYRLGGYPEGLLDIAVEQVHSITATNATLEGLEQSCTNSFSLYHRTKPPASTESVKRARKFAKGGSHALLHELAVRLKIEQAAAATTDGGAARADITNALKRFRPVATVLEAQVCARAEMQFQEMCSSLCTGNFVETMQHGHDR